VATAWEKEGKHLPQKGVWDRTRAELVDELRKRGSDVGAVIGDIGVFGAWVRINPLDGEGCKDINVTAFRHALIEADDQDLGHQLALIQELNLPCSAIVHSGGKSIHAIVKVDAADAADYRRRVDRLYEVCEKSGLKVDNANRNPSRLSRLPGVSRNGAPQYMIDGRCGAKTFDDWLTSIEELHDKLPDIESLADVWDDLPPLEPEVIKGLVRKGHKMLLAGPSKAAKSFDLLELSIAIAEGTQWHGWECEQGPVLYVNLELSRPSALHRLKNVYQSLGIPPANINKIDVWNLRGNAVPLDKLAPKLIRRAMAKGYIAIIIDPIYKVLTGDENSAEQMALFCNQFDRIATALGAATIYAHHHSKGSQGQKRSIDRSSGSGVFSRDPDAILDLIELDISKDRREVLYNHAAKATLEGFADSRGLDLDMIPEDQRQPPEAFLMAFQTLYPDHAFDMSAHLSNAHEAVTQMTGWRIECNLREFATPKPRRTWFRYPIHIEDTHDLLIDAKAAGEEAPWEADRRNKEDARKSKADAIVTEMEEAISASGGPGKATIRNVSEAIGKDEDTVRNRLKKMRQYRIHRGLILDAEKGAENDE
jgi:RecA-family ATPase